MTEEQAVDRIPFSPKEELMISSMASWMRFIGVVNIVIGLLGSLFLSVLLFFANNHPKISGLLAKKGINMTALVIAGAIVVGFLVVAIYQGSLLFNAGKYFEQVAKTDEADQLFVYEGFQRLKTFFILEVVFGGLSVLGSLSTVLKAVGK